ALGIEGTYVDPVLEVELGLVACIVAPQLLRHDVDGDVPTALPVRCHLRRARAVVVERDRLEEILDEVRKARWRLLAKRVDEILRRGIGRPLELPALDHLVESTVDAIFADVVLKGVHRDAALLVVDVLLVLVLGKWKLFLLLERPTAQIAIELQL